MLATYHIYSTQAAHAHREFKWHICKMYEISSLPDEVALTNIATPTGEVSEVEIFLRFDGVPKLAPSSVLARTCSQLSVFFRVHSLSVRGLTITCKRGSVIFSIMLDFAVHGLRALHALSPPSAAR